MTLLLVQAAEAVLRGALEPALSVLPEDQQMTSARKARSLNRHHQHVHEQTCPLDSATWPEAMDADSSM